MKNNKNVILTGLIMLFICNSIYAQDQSLKQWANENPEQAINISRNVLGLIDRGVSKAKKKRNLKKSKKILARLEKLGDDCALAAYSIDHNTGMLEYNQEAEIDCRNRKALAITMSEPYENNQIADDIAKDSTFDAEEEARRRAEEMRRIAEQKIAEERKNAIRQIESAKIEVYAFDETELSDSQKSELDMIAKTLDKYTDLKLLVVGHTCNIGYKNINMKKGLKRADIVRAYFIGRNIAPERILVDSKGENEPLLPNTSKDNRRQNRRVEFLLVS